MVARWSCRTKRSHREAPALCRGGLVSLARRIAGRRCESLIARYYRPCGATGPLSRILEWNRHGAVRHRRGSAARTGVRRVCPDRPRCSVRSSATRALGSNCRPRRGKLDRSQRSLDAWLGSANTLVTRLAQAPAKPMPIKPNDNAEVDSLDENKASRGADVSQLSNSRLVAQRKMAFLANP